MKVGVFTPLLSQFPLDKVFEKLKNLNIDTVELGTGNYPGDPHCKLSMLQDKAALIEKTGADAVIATDAGCLMNIAGCLRRRGSKVRALHLAEVLERT